LNTSCAIFNGAGKVSNFYQKRFLIGLQEFEVIFMDRKDDKKHTQTDEQADVEVEIVI